MHIAEGVLAPVILGAGAALTAAGTVIGLRRLDYERITTVGMLSALFFVASLIHVPVGFGSAHLTGNGLLGVLLGWACFPAILTGLALQAILFQYGGITVLGVNTCTMAFGGVLAWYVYRAAISILPGKKGVSIGAFLGGALGVAFAAILTAMALAFTSEGFRAAAGILLLAHLPIMLVEGIVTMFTVAFVARVRPEMLPPAFVKTTRK